MSSEQEVNLYNESDNQQERIYIHNIERAEKLKKVGEEIARSTGGEYREVENNKGEKNYNISRGVLFGDFDDENYSFLSIGYHPASPGKISFQWERNGKLDYPVDIADSDTVEDIAQKVVEKSGA